MWYKIVDSLNILPACNQTRLIDFRAKTVTVSPIIHSIGIQLDLGYIIIIIIFPIVRRFLRNSSHVLLRFLFQLFSYL